MTKPANLVLLFSLSAVVACSAASSNDEDDSTSAELTQSFEIVGYGDTCLEVSTAVPDTVVSAEESAARPAFPLMLSHASSYASPLPLSGATVQGAVYLFTADSAKSPRPANLSMVEYYLDDADRKGAPFATEKLVPYEPFGGGAWDSSKLADGVHTITETVFESDPPNILTSTSTFTVNNHAPAYLRLAACNGNAQQRFSQRGTDLVGPGGQCVQALGGISANHAPLELAPCTEDKSQAWKVSGKEIKDPENRCFDIPSHQGITPTFNGTAIQIYDCWGSANQAWTLKSLGGSAPAPTTTTTSAPTTTSKPKPPPTPTTTVTAKPPPVPTTTATTTPPPPPATCTSFTYSAYGDCQSNGTQTRTVVSSMPTGCKGGSPVLSQSCTYIDGEALYTSYCASCHGNAKKGRPASAIQSAITNNTGGMGSLKLSSAQIAAIAAAK